MGIIKIMKHILCVLGEGIGGMFFGLACWIIYGMISVFIPFLDIGRNCYSKREKDKLYDKQIKWFMIVGFCCLFLLGIGIECQKSYEEGHDAGYVECENEYTNYYDSGYDNGYADGQNDIDTDEYYQDGYDDGYADGQNDAYEEDSYIGPSADEIHNMIGDAPVYGGDDYSDQRRAEDNARDAAVKKQEELKSK